MAHISAWEYLSPFVCDQVKNWHKQSRVLQTAIPDVALIEHSIIQSLKNKISANTDHSLTATNNRFRPSSPAVYIMCAGRLLRHLFVP